MGGAPPMGASPGGVPSANSGAMANAKSQIRGIYNVFVEALKSFPMGSDDHKALLNIMNSINKLAPPTAEVPGQQATTMAGLAQQAQQSAALASLGGASSAGGSAGGGGAMGGPPTPAMPPSLAQAAA